LDEYVVKPSKIKEIIHSYSKIKNRWKGINYEKIINFIFAYHNYYFRIFF
jgi:hypothetical protein